MRGPIEPLHVRFPVIFWTELVYLAPKQFELFSITFSPILPKCLELQPTTYGLRRSPWVDGRRLRPESGIPPCWLRSIGTF